MPNQPSSNPSEQPDPQPDTQPTDPGQRYPGDAGQLADDADLMDDDAAEPGEADADPREVTPQ